MAGIRARGAALGGVVLVLLAGAPAPAQTEDVLILDVPQSFVPDEVEIPLGVDVRWTKPVGTTIPHNVVQEAGLFVSGAPTTEAIDFTVLPSAGEFPYQCAVHGPPQGDMAGVVRVSPRMLMAPGGAPFTIQWATRATETGEAFDVRFRIDDGSWRVWKKDVEGFRGVFGRDGEPVRLRRGHVYDFQARSQIDVDTPEAHSRWSPVARVPLGA